MLALSALLSAQQVVLEAPSIDAVWTGADGRLRAQCGRRLVVCGDPVTSVAIPKDAVAFDHGPSLAWATARGFRVATPSGVVSRDGGFTLRDEPGLVPLRVPLFLSSSFVLVPGSSAVGAVDLGSGASVDLGVKPRHGGDRGWGLSGQVVDDLVVPHVLGFERGGRMHVLSGTGGSWFRLAGLVRTALPPVDVKDTKEGSEIIEGFEHDVPPLLADLDHDGVPDLVRVEVKRGIVAIQGGLDRAEIPPPRVILLKAPVLLADAADTDGDGRPELILVVLPPLTPLQQLAILVQSKLTATVLVYALDGPGGSAPAPRTSLDVPVGVEVLVRDQDRRARFRDLIGFARGKALVATPGKRARAFDLAGGEAAELGPVPEGEWSEPLRPARAGDSVAGVLKTASGARLVRFDLR